MSKTPLLAFLFASALTLPTLMPAAPLVVTATGNFSSTVVKDQLAAPLGTWSLLFGLNSTPAVTNTDANSFDVQYGGFRYLLNGSPINIYPASIRFENAANGGAFTVFFGPESGFVNGTPIPEFVLYGPQLFSGAVASPSFALGSGLLSEAYYSDAQGASDVVGASAGTFSISNAPEPSTLLLPLLGVLLFAVPFSIKSFVRQA